MSSIVQSTIHTTNISIENAKQTNIPLVPEVSIGINGRHMDSNNNKINDIESKRDESETKNKNWTEN